MKNNNYLLDEKLIPEVRKTLQEDNPWLLDDLLKRNVQVWSDLTIGEIGYLCRHVPIPGRGVQDSVFSFSPYDIAFGDAFKKETYEEAK